jgi:acylphosphatase
MAEGKVVVESLHNNSCLRMKTDGELLTIQVANFDEGNVEVVNLSYQEAEKVVEQLMEWLSESGKKPDPVEDAVSKK